MAPLVGIPALLAAASPEQLGTRVQVRDKFSLTSEEAQAYADKYAKLYYKAGFLGSFRDNGLDHRHYLWKVESRGGPNESVSGETAPFAEPVSGDEAVTREDSGITDRPSGYCSQSRWLREVNGTEEQFDLQVPRWDAESLRLIEDSVFADTGSIADFSAGTEGVARGDSNATDDWSLLQWEHFENMGNEKDEFEIQVPMAQREQMERIRHLQTMISFTYNLTGKKWHGWWETLKKNRPTLEEFLKGVDADSMAREVRWHTLLRYTSNS